MKIIKEDNKQFLKKDSERDLFTHHKKYLGTEVPEGYFLKSKNQILNKINTDIILEEVNEVKKHFVFWIRPPYKYVAAASLVFILSLTIWLQKPHEEDILKEVNTDLLMFSDTVLIESLLVEENEVDAFADITLFREILVKSELFEQKIDNLVFENLILEDSLINNYLDDGLIETIIL